MKTCDTGGSVYDFILEQRIGNVHARLGKSSHIHRSVRAVTSDNLSVYGCVVVGVVRPLQCECETFCEHSEILVQDEVQVHHVLCILVISPVIVQVKT